MNETDKEAAKQLFKELIYWSARFAEELSEEDYRKLQSAADVLREIWWPHSKKNL